MAKQGNRQPQTRRPAPNRSGKRPPQAAAKQQSRPAARKSREQESTPGEMMWKLALILCTGLVVIALLFASVNGGSKYVGLTDKDNDNDTNATPTPPVATIDPSLNVQGSDMTPIPPSASPDATTESGAATGDSTGDGQALTP